MGEEEWVMTNSERVQRLKDKAVLSLTEASHSGKGKWDAKSKAREFK